MDNRYENLFGLSITIEKKYVESVNDKNRVQEFDKDKYIIKFKDIDKVLARESIFNDTDLFKYILNELYKYMVIPDTVELSNVIRVEDLHHDN